MSTMTPMSMIPVPPCGENAKRLGKECKCNEGFPDGDPNVKCCTLIYCLIKVKYNCHKWNEYVVKIRVQFTVYVCVLYFYGNCWDVVPPSL